VSQLSRENVGALTSHNPMGIHGPYLIIFTIFELQKKIQATSMNNTQQFKLDDKFLMSDT
jgi:hypothetical protein